MLVSSNPDEISPVPVSDADRRRLWEACEGLAGVEL